MNISQIQETPGRNLKRQKNKGKSELGSSEHIFLIQITGTREPVLWGLLIDEFEKEIILFVSKRYDIQRATKDFCNDKAEYSRKENKQIIQTL